MGVRVLSLFDGISCGQVALEREGFEVGRYYASEVNEDSIKVTLDNYPDTIQLGSITELIKLDDDGNVLEVSQALKDLPKIDILIGGSPCQGLSRSKTTGKLNLEDPRSKLFFNYVKIKEWLIENNNADLIFLLENVKPDNEALEVMNSTMGCEPYIINSDRFSAQDRLRLYWSNINVDTTNMPDKKITIKDILDENHNEKINNLKDIKYPESIVMSKHYVKWDTSGKGHYSQQNRARYLYGKMNTLAKSNNGDKTRIYLGDYNYRNASVLELERCQTLPDGYTGCIKSKSSRRGMIGDGWTVDVIAYILSYINK